MRSRDSERLVRDIDWVLLGGALALAGIGISSLASATGMLAVFATRQVVWIGIGILVLAALAAVDYRKWLDLAPFAYVLNALVLVYVLAFGHKVNGSKSWLSQGSINVQPSEFMKIFTVLVLARILASERTDRLRWGRVAAAGFVVLIPFMLIVKQPDMGTALTFVALLATALLIAGLSPKTWLMLGLSGVLGVGLTWNHVLRDYQKERIRTFLYPEMDPLAIGYQIIQSRIAIGSGGLFGKGYAAGTQSQLNFIPEKHTDFIFPVVAEEWGFAGSLLVVGLYALLVSRGLRIASESRDAFGAYLVAGIITIVATHVLVNLGMVTGLLPTIGIPLPLMSYGGSSIVSTLMGIGLVLNVGMRRHVHG